jgi:phenylalanyl-tRNA synthetase beta chain
MIITLHWLKDYLTTNATGKEIVSALNSIGLESEIKLDRSILLQDFVIAQIIEAKNHPSIPNLRICKVQANHQQTLQIVCKAINATEGLKVALAPIGSVVPSSGLKIDLRKVGGIESEGMLCSEDELMLAKENDGIMEIDNSAKIGDKLINYYSVGDVIIDVEITPNRGDCLGIYGIARELAAKKIGLLKQLHLPNLLSNAGNNNLIECEILNKELIPYFSLWKVCNISNFQLPTWMKQRLSDVGIKIFNNVLDVASFVSHATGQPLHIYDASKMKSKVSVGLALQNTTQAQFIDAIDSEKYALDPEDLVHIMEGEVINLSGIIGNIETSFSNNCQDIILEAASFNKNTIAKTAQRLHVNTDAKFKFERHVDPYITPIAAKFALDLILKLSSGSYFAGKTELDNRKGKENKILFSLDYLEKLIGIDDLQNAQVEEILKSLGFGLEIFGHERQYLVEIPSWRSDIENASDLCQEIIRIYGYINIKAKEININLKESQINYQETTKSKIKSLLAYLGYTQVYNWSFHNNDGIKFKSDDQDVMQIENPVSQEMSYLRNSLIPGIIATARQNQARSEEFISIFEVGYVFNHKDTSKVASSSSLHLCILKNGPEKELSLYSGKRASDFFDVKGAIEKIFEEIDIKDIKYVRPNIVEPFLHPKVSLDITLEGKKVGHISELHPAMQKMYNLQNKSIIACINLDTVLQYIPKVSIDESYFYPSIYQKVKRDFAFLVDKQKDIGETIIKLYNIDKNIIKQVTLFDLFSSDLLPAGKKSFTIQVILQSDTKTLTEDEINDIETKIINFMYETLHAELRGIGAN